MFLVLPPSTKEMACIIRLFSEAYSTIAAHIRFKVEASDGAVVKKLAPAERARRMYEQQQRLSGLDIRRQFRAWRYCLIRRGLALDQANIMCYKEHERLVEKLID